MTSRQRFGVVALLWALLAAWPGAAAAQTGAASITGLVTDESGAAVPGVTVTATNQATNVAYTAVSNDAGNYTITSAAGRHLRRQGRAYGLPHHDADAD